LPDASAPIAKTTAAVETAVIIDLRVIVFPVLRFWGMTREKGMKVTIRNFYDSDNR
jgi:hypothetical protein